MSDAIKKPAHYNQGPIECIDAMKIVLTPEEFRGYLKGNVFKYLWREKDKNGIEDLRKGREYYDRLIESYDKSLADIKQGLVKAWTCENGKAKQVYPESKWTPRVGDWVRIKKPADTQSSACIWDGNMDKYDGQVIQVDEVEYDIVVHDDWGFSFDWLEQVEQPVVKESLITKPDPGEGYRLLGKNPPEKLLDTDEGLFACGLDGQQWLSVNYSSGEQLPSVYYRRKIDVETLKQSPQLPDGWRWLEVGGVFRKGDTTNTIEPISEHWVGTQCVVKHVALRRNRFEVGEKVVRVFRECVYEITAILDMGCYEMQTPSDYKIRLYAIDLAPYIEETK